MLALRIIQGRCRLLILRALEGMSQKVLTAQLRALEADGVVVRTVPAQVPPRVDYALNHLGQELMPVLESPHAFGEQVGQDGYLCTVRGLPSRH